MRYSALSPGKRIRPILCLAAAEACGADPVVALDAACAVELIHAFSLIHDDLPAIDNDDLRRGQPTCHVKFGEATAILAGDALFALAFRAIAGLPAPAERVVAVLKILAEATGSDGLVGGEMLDILSEGAEPSRPLLEKIHRGKTGALIRAATEIGAVLAGVDSSVRKACAGYGEAIGLAFQIADDVLNETSTAEQLGKAVGSDKERSKLTYPAVVGLEESRRIAEGLRQAALQHLESLPGDTSLLVELAGFSVVRSH